MYKGKRIKKFTHMSKRAALLVLSLVMILSISVGGTLAYLIAQTGPKTNTFQPGDVTTETYEPGWTDKVSDEKKDVSFINTGNVPVYMRAQIVVEWVAENGDVLAVVPEEGEGKDYKLTLASNDKWEKQGDFYYYKEIVQGKPKDGNAFRTAELIESCKLLKDNPDGCRLRVVVLSQAVQADANQKAVTEAWGSEIASTLPKLETATTGTNT